MEIYKLHQLMHVMRFSSCFALDKHLNYDSAEGCDDGMPDKAGKRRSTISFQAINTSVLKCFVDLSFVLCC